MRLAASRGFAEPLIERGIIVCSSWAANGIAVAEFCLGQVLLVCKGYFRNVRDCLTPERNNQKIAFHRQGTYGEKVAIIGAGQIGRRLALLRPFRLKVLVVDPYLSEPEAEDLMALLDVTDPEPTPAGSALYELPNVQLTSHLAGAHNDEVVRMADFMIQEFVRWSRGEPLRSAVDQDELKRMA